MTVSETLQIFLLILFPMKQNHFELYKPKYTQKREVYSECKTASDHGNQTGVMETIQTITMSYKLASECKMIKLRVPRTLSAKIFRFGLMAQWSE